MHNSIEKQASPLKWSLVKRIMTVVVLGWMIVIISTMLTAKSSLTHNLISEYFSNTKSALLNHQEKIESIYDQINEKVISMIPLFIDDEYELVSQHVLNSILKTAQLSTLFDELIFLDNQGVTISQYPFILERAGMDYSDRPFIKKVIDTQEYVISYPVLGRVTGLPSIFFVHPVKNANHEMLGMVVARIALDKNFFFQQFSKAHVPFDGNLFVVDFENGLILASTDQSMIMLPFKDYFTIEDAIHDYSHGEVNDASGGEFFYSLVSIDGIGWNILNVTPRVNVIKHVNYFLSNYLFVIVPVIFLACLVVCALVYQMFKPLRLAVVKMEEDLLNQSGYSLVEVSRMDEVGKLLTTINQLQIMRESQEKMKDELLAMVTHEIRTPLTSIRAAIRLLSVERESMDSHQSKRLVDICQRNSDRLMLLINDLLDLSSLSNGKLVIDLQCHDLHDIVSESVNDLYSMAKHASIELELSHKQQRIIVNIDKTRFQQVLFNLLSNAIKYSGKNTVVKVEVSLIQDFAIVGISDQGIGIPEHYHQKIFERFTQLDSSDKRSQGGTGLGLAIASEFMKEMKGEITLSSIVGVGTTFFIKLPIVSVTQEGVV